MLIHCVGKRSLLNKLIREAVRCVCVGTGPVLMSLGFSSRHVTELMFKTYFTLSLIHLHCVCECVYVYAGVRNNNSIIIVRNLKTENIKSRTE